MFIKSLHAENWKCFASEIDLDFSTIEIFSFSNGAGKTSVLEAVHYGIWGKTDYKMSTYQNHEDSPTRVNVSFDIDGVDYKIEREFPAGKAVLYKSDKKFKEGIKEVFDYINSIMDYNVAKRLWFKGEISEAPILDFNFFKKEILAEKLKDPITLHQHYTHQANVLSRELNMIQCVSCRPLAEIQKDIDDLSAKLKQHSNTISNSEYARACQVKIANEKFDVINKYFVDKNCSPVSTTDITKWKSINAESLTNQINLEKKKVTDDVLSHLSNNVINTVFDYYNKNGKCMICDNEWSPAKKEHIESLLKNGVRDLRLESDLEAKLKYKESFSDELISKSEEYYKLKREAEAMPNYAEVIKNYNSENEKMWEQLDDLNKEKDFAVRNEEAAKRMNALDKEIKDYKEKRDFLKAYLDTATESLTASLFTESSKMLSSINSDYSEVSISPEDNTVQVIVRGKRLSLNQLSRGEKTLVALSLIYTIRDIFCPGIPLIFDESFSALSSNNNNQVINIVKDSYEQLFIISHNADWVDYPNYGPDVNVRTEW